MTKKGVKNPKKKNATSFQIGNKAALNNKNSGRPRIYEDDELEELGLEMIQAIKDNPNWTFIQQFAIYKEFPSDWLYDFARRHPVFRGFYSRAKDLLGARMASQTVDERKLHQCVINRLLPVYFGDLKAYDKEMKQASDPGPTTIVFAPARSAKAEES